MIKSMNEKDIYNYLAGDKKGEKANKIEKDALKDPFLSESLEGFEDFDSYPMDAIDDIKQQINQNKSLSQRKEKRKLSPKTIYWLTGVAAAIAIIFFIYPKHNAITVSDDFVISMEIVQPIDILIPKDMDKSLRDKMQEDLSNQLGQSRSVGQGKDTIFIFNKQANQIDIFIPKVN